MPRRKKPVYHSDLPEHVIESIARLIYPDIVAYYESEEGQREFAEWMAQQEVEQAETESEH